MAWFVSAFGVFVLLIGILGMLAPEQLKARLSGWKQPSRVWWAVGFRLVFGIALLVAAPECRQPVVVQVVGALMLLSAFAFALMGPQRFGAFVGWCLERPAHIARRWMVVAVLLGALMIWSGA